MLKLVYVYAVFLLFVYYYVYRYYFSLHSRRSVIERTLIENILFSGDAGEMRIRQIQDAQNLICRSQRTGTDQN